MNKFKTMEPIYIEGLYTKFMRLGGYPGLSYHGNNKWFPFFIKYILSVVLCVIVYPLTVIIIYSVVSSNNIQGIMNACYSGSVHCLIILRTLFFHAKRHQIMNCFCILKPDYLKCMNHSANNSEQLYKDGIRKHNMVSYYWVYMLRIYTIVWVVRPVLNQLYDMYFRGKDYTPGAYKILLYNYPFSINYTPMSELILLYEFIALAFLAEFMLFQELTFSLIVSMTCTQISIIQSSLQVIQHNEYSIFQSKNYEQEMYQKIVDCIQDHQKINRLADDIQKIFAPMMSLQLAVGTVLSVAGSVRFTKVTALMDYGENLLFFLILLTYLAIPCWKSSQLLNISKNFGDAAYKADWVNGSKNLRQTIQIIVMKGQKPLKLRALWGVAPLDLETILNVIQLSYSYFTVLRAVDTS